MRLLFIQRTAVLIGLVVCSLSAYSAINLSDPIPVDPQIKIGKLANGLTYYIKKNGKPEKKVELRLVVKAGSILEDDDQQGLAHFTEHMAFNGSTHFKKHELISYLQSIGVKFGADLNAYTSFDETVYMLPIPTDKKENLETGFQVLEDWAHGLTMNDADIDKERAIVLEELRLRKGASDRMQQILLPRLFNDSQYAKRLPIGKEAILTTFKYETIKRFYADWYRPDLMAVVVVGDVDPVEAEKMIKAHFEKLENPAKERPRTYASIAPRTASTAVIITDSEATNNIVGISYQIEPNKVELTFADYRSTVIKNLFQAMLSQRLSELTQQANPPFLFAHSSIGRLGSGFEAFGSMAGVGKAGTDTAISAVIQENERARQFGFSAAELERTKKNMLHSFERGYNERDKSNSGAYASEFTRNFLQQESIPGIANEFHYMTEILPGITLAEVNLYAQQTIPSNSPKLVSFMGSSKSDTPLPLDAALLKTVIAAEKMPVSAKEEKAVAAQLMEHPPKAGSIVAEKQNKALGLTELTLSNGIKVILKPTDFKNDQVLMRGLRWGGQSLYDDKEVYDARYASTIAGQMGVGDFSPVDLTKILAGKSASAWAAMDNYTDYVGGNSGSADIETMLQLLYMKLTVPRTDAALFKAFISSQQELTKNTMAHPEVVLADTLLATLYNNHPRAPSVPKPEDFSNVHLDRAMKIYAERFSSAKDMTLILVGNFDLEKIKPLIATYVASLPTKDIVTSYKDMEIRPVTGVVKKEVRRGRESKSNVSINFTGKAVYSIEEAMRFQALLDVMNIKIIDVLREKLTLIYGGGVGGSLSKIPDESFAIGSNLPCGPENVDKVIAALFAEIQKIKDDGPQPSDLEKVKQNWSKQHPISLRQNDYWIGQLYLSILNGTDPESILAYDQRLNAITTQDVQNAAKRYFNMDNYVQVVLYPEK